ncbi:MAG: diaminopimelate epimerase [Bacteroidota bacterium]|nr:diaminopimelate epimerase [Bacteroidota bacterium]MDX5431644.1 diaminopimelate epimerase [Bacteroidota bacterium]MDX5470362.1 diaminopimelate epimerase [Bacteroidota bacterium]
MKIRFYKYQGTGNDFILIDNRRLGLPHHTQELFEHWCDRRFGIGADGLILLEEEEGFDFRMVYFNSDGRQSTMCGNGGRCIAQFAHDLGLVGERAHFIAVDGPHEAVISEERVELKMQDVVGVENIDGDYYLHTGSPHYVRFMKEGLASCDLVPMARSIRYNDRFKAEGTNVNMVQDAGDYLDVRTYERGVEDETYSCGTGVTAVALVNHLCSPSGQSYSQAIHTPGGELEVKFEKTGEGTYQNIWLCGPARFVFQGEISRV